MTTEQFETEIIKDFTKYITCYHSLTEEIEKDVHSNKAKAKQKLLIEAHHNLSITLEAGVNAYRTSLLLNPPKENNPFTNYRPFQRKL